ncbi:hypothetical protein BV898_01577 [Hypsibius exemplaris]|uniref:Uncharacterized protein n=1 Tax=Hypsibius exemplaris TaxID=2072580 RepID=A0A1W0XAF8_HYPEX|nr:hypothetical protein BV898_01577 [Hypsibius exemplaris]
MTQLWHCNQSDVALSFADSDSSFFRNVGSVRTALSCSNDRCLEPISNDSRADGPCRACGTVNKVHRQKTQTVLRRIDEFEISLASDAIVRNVVCGDMALMRELIREGEKFLHSPNIMLGMVLFDANNFLSSRSFATTNAEWLNYGNKCLRIME